MKKVRELLFLSTALLLSSGCRSSTYSSSIYSEPQTVFNHKNITWDQIIEQSKSQLNLTLDTSTQNEINEIKSLLAKNFKFRNREWFDQVAKDLKLSDKSPLFSVEKGNSLIIDKLVRELVLTFSAAKTHDENRFNDLQLWFDIVKALSWWSEHLYIVIIEKKISQVWPDFHKKRYTYQNLRVIFDILMAYNEVITLHRELAEREYSRSANKKTREVLEKNFYLTWKKIIQEFGQKNAEAVFRYIRESRENSNPTP